MVLSMLSVIQNVSKHRSNSGTETSPGGGGDHPQPSEMSRRKQRNPKPFFTSNEEDGEEEEDRNSSSSHSHSRETEKDEELPDPGGPDEGGKSHEDRDSPRDLSSLVKVEVIEHSKSPPSSRSPTNTAASAGFTPSPPAGTSALPPLTPMPPPPSTVTSRMNEDFPSKNNMFHFGDVIVAHHPDTTPVPMVIPMVYLYPLLDKRDGNGVRYRMLVPLSGGPPPPPPPELLIPPSMLMTSPPPPPPPPKTSRRNSSSSSAPPVKKESPLDLSKSPPAERGSPSDPQAALALHQKEIEAQINFLKVKHLEFMKNQQAASSSSSSTSSSSSNSSPPSRCEECNINFSKHQNYVAHKKYYCSGGGGGAPATPKTEIPEAHAEEPVEPSRKPPATSPKQRSAAAAAAAALGLLGLSSSPPRPGTNNNFELVPNKELLLLKQHQELINKELLMNKEALLQAAAVGGLPREPSSSDPQPPMLPPPGPHFVCEGCGIKFKSVNNLQAHQARYCAGLRKAEEMNNAFEAMMKTTQQPQLPLGLSPAEMMSFLNAKSMEIAANAKETKEDFCCILCGYKEDSVDKLKDHINMHFIGQVKRPRSSSMSSNNNNNPAAANNESTSESKSPEPEKKKIKVEEPPAEKESSPPPPTRSKPSPSPSGESSMKCDSCEIGFSHLSNFLAHKKYYCRGVRNPQASSP